MSKTTKLSPTDRKLSRQQHLLDKYRSRDTNLKWSTALLGLLALVLLLLFGFATDWTAGLRKSPPSSNHATTTDTNGSTSPATAIGANTADNTSDTTTTHKSTDTTTTNTTSTNSTTTNGSSTSNTTGGGDSSTTSGSSNDLLDLYSNSSAGNNINSVLKQADVLGVTGSCRSETVFQVCDFTQNGNTVTVRDISGTGLVTSVTKNF